MEKSEELMKYHRKAYDLLNQNASHVIEAIRYSRKSIVKEEKSLPMELSQDNLLKRFNIIVDGVEITERELSKRRFT